MTSSIEFYLAGRSLFVLFFGVYWMTSLRLTPNLNCTMAIFFFCNPYYTFL